jgi:hypothetical protein
MSPNCHKMRGMRRTLQGDGSPLTRRAVEPQGMGMPVLRLRFELRSLACTAELALEPLSNCMPSNALCDLERKQNM